MNSKNGLNNGVWSMKGSFLFKWGDFVSSFSTSVSWPKAELENENRKVNASKNVSGLVFIR